MKNQLLIPTVTPASASRAHASTRRCGWLTEFFGATNPTVMGATKPYHQRPKEASPPT